MRYLFYLFILITVAAGFYFYRAFTRKPADVSRMVAVEKISATELIKKFSLDEKEANKKYAGKVIEITGVIKGIAFQADSVLTVLLGDPAQAGSVSCTLNKKYPYPPEKLIEGRQVSIKGVCIGYLLDVECNRCIFVN